MFYSENLLAKEGPLAQVWLAANLERRLSKNQFLQSNIVQSTQAIVKATSENDDSEALALRLSGQLLYGVVRIYSRKAKYLLDDVSDALLKLKSAFKSNSNTVTLPVNATIVPSVNQLILQDTITQSDLLYQEPLTFDEVSSKSGNFFGRYGMEDTTVESIELPRTQVDELDNLQNDDLDIDLNFDIDENRDDQNRSDGPLDMSFDRSIEVGRAADDEANLSSVQRDDAFDRGIDLDFGWDDQLVPIAEETEQTQGQIMPPTRKQRKQRISTAGQKRIISDKEIEIPIRDFSDTSAIVSTEDEQELDLNTKRSYIDSILKDNNYIRDDIAQSLLAVKRQKISQTPLTEDIPDLEHSAEENEIIQGQGPEQDRAFDEGIELDFGWDDQTVTANPQEHDQDEGINALESEEALDDFNSNSLQQGISESTTMVAKQLGGIFETKDVASFTDVIEKDSLSGNPLSSIPKKEATRVFFELLVLGTGDALELKQNELFGEIEIKPRQSLFQKFL